MALALNIGKCTLLGNYRENNEDSVEVKQFPDMTVCIVADGFFNASDIPIVFTGLRPGEKLQEELWETGAVVEATPHPELRLVKEEDGLDAADLMRSLDALVAAARSGTRLQFEAALAQWLPSYVPSSVDKHLVM